MWSAVISMAFSAIKATIKNEDSKRKYRAVWLELFNAIKMAYLGDPDFQ